MTCPFKIKFIVFISFLVSSSHLSAQKDSGRIVVNTQIVGRDTLPVLILKAYEAGGKRDPNAMKKFNEMNRLIVNVKTVLPYAKLAKQTLNQIESAMDSIKDEKQQKIYIKDLEKQMKSRFSAELKNLTIDQGRILIKLIDRETGNTTYALVKEFRGSISAFFWQKVAQVFGDNLKSTYDSLKDDRAIEQIIRNLDNPNSLQNDGN
jgi:glutaredoxin